jgi:hypothetical protein
MKIIHTTLLPGLMFLAACSGPQDEARLQADTLLHNGKVVTFDSAPTAASVVAIKGEQTWLGGRLVYSQ